MWGLNPITKPLPLLHIDDSSNERLLVKRAIFVTNTPFAVYGASGLESAIPYFQSHGLHPDAFPEPSIVLLDYDMGDHTGADFLYWLRVMKKITSIPVVMFTGSVEKSQIASCYAMGASYFICKPKRPERLQAIVRALYDKQRWQHDASILRLEEYEANPTKPTSKESLV